MKVRHKNSREVFDLTIPCYTKLNGMYGFLVQGGGGVYWIVDNECEYIGSEFEIV